MAARALGAPDGADGRHILPNTVPPLIVQATISFPLAILAEAALAYLGLGTQPPHPSWGLMLGRPRTSCSRTPGSRSFPGAAIALTVLGFNLLGDGLRDLLDPRAPRVVRGRGRRPQQGDCQRGGRRSPRACTGRPRRGTPAT